MIYLMRHGADDDTRLGGWSDAGLSDKGQEQAKQAGERLADGDYDIKHIFSSDLARAKETANIVSGKLGLPVTLLEEFRETNNGELAGISTEQFKRDYPGLYFSSLDWEQRYPGGESPKMFYERIRGSWTSFKKRAEALDGNILLVTHAGVMNIILCEEAGVQFTNKEVRYKIGNAEIVSFTCHECKKV